MKNNLSIGVDIYSWLKEAQERGTVPMNGLFRHAEHMGREFTPAAVITDETKFPVKGLRIISEYLKKDIAVISPKNSRFDVWITLGVDQCAPDCQPKSRVCASILHDTMSYDGWFGTEAKERFVYGATHNQVFLFNSATVARSARRIDAFSHHALFIPYGSAHSFEEPFFSKELIRTKESVSIHSLFKRKNLGLTLKLARSFGTPHTHYGGAGDYTPDYWDILSDATRDNRAVWFSDANDAVIRDKLRTCFAFICMSAQEGFSMPAMEAILCGVPHIVLSDIPVHREIYGMFEDEGIMFIPPEVIQAFDPVPQDLSELPAISAELQRFMFAQYKWDNVIAPFKRYLASI